MKKKYFKTMMVLGATLAGGLLLAGSAVAGPRVDFGDEGYLQMDVRLQGILDYTDFGSGSDGKDDRYDLYLRRARIVFTGMLNDTWGAKFQTCGGTSATRNFGGVGYELAKSNSKTNSQIRLTDGYIIGLIDDAFNIKLGLTKIPFTRGNLDECFNPLSTERSAFVYSPYGTDATKNSRDMGLVASGNFVQDHLKYFAGVMEGREGATDWENPFNNTEFISTPEPSSNLEYVGRVHYSFLNPESKPTAMGYKGSYLGKNGKILTVALAGAYEKDAAYKNTSPAGAMGTPGFTKGIVLDQESVDYTAWTTDVFFEYPFENSGVLTATALYLNADFEDAYKTATAIADRNTMVGGAMGQRDGYYVKAAYILPMTLGAKGKLQPFVRYEDWNIAYLMGVTDQTVQQEGIGFNYYVLGNDKLRFSMEYTHNDFDKSTKLGDYLNQTGANDSMYDSYNIITCMFMVQI